MITYELPGGGPKRMIDNKWNLGQELIWTGHDNSVKVPVKVKAIYVKFTGINYLLDMPGGLDLEVQESELKLGEL